MTIKSKKILIWSLIVMIFTLLSIWLIPIIFEKPKLNVKGNKNQVMQGIETGNNSPVTQIGDNATFNNYGSTFILDAEQAKKFMEKYTQNIVPITASPQHDLAVFSPSITFVNWKDGSIVYGQKVTGCVTAHFDIRFLNISENSIKDLKTEWTIFDNGNRISGLDEWQSEASTINIIGPHAMAKMIYGPHIGANGFGTLELILDYEYTNDKTEGIKKGQYKALVDYITEKNSKPRKLMLSPQ